jgi:hypothetical protein
MIIRTYEDALAAIGKKASEIEFPEADVSIKPTDNLRAPVGNCRIEGLILARTEAILFE